MPSLEEPLQSGQYDPSTVETRPLPMPVQPNKHQGMSHT